jgi:hypothetical protein
MCGGSRRLAAPCHHGRQGADRRELKGEQKNWNALHADPAFLPYRSAAVPLIEKVNGAFHVDEVFMHPTDFSAIK